MKINYTPVEDQLVQIFRSILFSGISKILKEASAQFKPKTLQNAAGDALREALKSGKVQYQDGKFFGEFSGRIATDIRSMGGKFDKRTGMYSIDMMRVPNWVLSEASVYNLTARAVHEKIGRELDLVQDNLDELIGKHQVDARVVVGEVEKGFQDVARKMQLNPALSMGAKERLVQGYNENMNLWIKSFSEDSILQLRRAVEKNAQQGYRFDSLIDRIEDRYDVSKNKAKFLARQETSLFMSKFRKERFTEAGYARYKWKANLDARVRDRHAELDGTIQFYDSPPIVDQTTGRRGNPGEDFNCRCVDIPLVDSPLELAQR